jgi:hypothetical protein
MIFFSAVVISEGKGGGPKFDLCPRVIIIGFRSQSDNFCSVYDVQTFSLDNLGWFLELGADKVHLGLIFGAKIKKQTIFFYCNLGDFRGHNRTVRHYR